jgi:hypothetical protein
VGYNIHIYRRANCSDDGNDITREQWVAYIECDPALVKGPFWEQGSSVDWAQRDGLEGWFTYLGGAIYTKNPGLAAIQKACEIAAKLGARVQGDEEEFYRSDGAFDPPLMASPQKPMWQNLFGRQE